MTPLNGAESGGTDAFTPLPGRADAMAALDQHIGTMQGLSWTRIKGIGLNWQPSDDLPDFSEPEAGFRRIRDVQEQARQLPADILLVLAGNTLTEKGLPTFTADIATIYGSQGSGAGRVAVPLPNMRKWFGEWAGEERRHEEALGGWLRFTGRIDMDAFDRSTQLFLEDGMDLGIGGDPYKGIIYTSFQEMATHRSHVEIVKLLHRYGNKIIATTCGKVAADEAKHASTYRRFADVLFQSDPNGMMCALRDMLQHKIVMPAHNMREVNEGGDAQPPGEMFAAFSALAARLEVYTAADYAKISRDLLLGWKVGELAGTTWKALPMQGLHDEGKAAQEKILRIQSITERYADRQTKPPEPSRDWSWLVKAKS
jgi:acyl-[acyl-carrier-protein] desaturase